MKLAPGGYNTTHCITVQKNEMLFVRPCQASVFLAVLLLLVSAVRVPAADESADTSGLRCEHEQGVDYPGDAVQGDIRWEHNVNSVDRCCDLCKSTPSCKYWTLHPGREICWLKKKSVKPYRKLHDGVISGKVVGKKKGKKSGVEEQVVQAPTQKEEAPKKVVEQKDVEKSDRPVDNVEKSQEEKETTESQKEEKEASKPETKQPKEQTPEAKKDKTPKKQDVKGDATKKKKKDKKKTTNAGAPAPPPQRDPARAKAAFNRGHALYTANKHSEAIPHLEEASELDRDGNVDMYLGMCYENQKQWESAVRAYEGAIVKGGLTGNNKAMTHNNLGLLYRDRQQRHADAERQYRASIAAAEAAGYGDTFFHAHKNLARLFEKNGRAADAQPHLEIAADMMGDDGLRFYSALLLPYVYSDDADIARWREAFRRNIALLATRQAPVPVAAIALVAGSVLAVLGSVYLCCLSRRLKRAVQRQPLWLLGMVPCALVAVPAGLHVLLAKKGIRIENPFRMEGVPQYYLSYHGQNDAEINAEISALFRASTPSVSFQAPHVAGYAPPGPGSKVRVGFFSYYFREHSVSKMIMGLLHGLDRGRVWSVLLNIGKEDQTTSKLRGMTSKYLHLMDRPLDVVQKMIADERLDVLVIAEIGMDPHAYAVAHARLAPVQIAMHGHASTTGIDTLDYYVSYEGFSEPRAQSHYSERLVILPGLTPLTRYYDLVPFGISESMLTPAGVAAFKERFRIPLEATVYACLQTIFKVSPKLDYVSKRILQGDDKAVILMKELPMTDQVGKLVLARMRETLTEKELKRIVFLPPLSDKDYPDTFKTVDVIFDSFPFGGHTSTLDAFSAGVPVVTWPTDLMSGRCTQGFYHSVGLPELIAGSLEEYIDITLKVGRDKAYRTEVSAKIGKGMEKLKKDETSVQAWNAFLQDVVHGEQRVAHLLAPRD